MKIIATICRLILGLAFTVFGLNGFLHFMPMGQMPAAAANWMKAMPPAYMQAVFAVQLACGALLLAGVFVPLALVVLASVIVNILLFHLTMAPGGIVGGVIAAALWVVVAAGNWPALAPLLRPWVKRGH
jgi:putative oxidoreductase